MTDRQLQDQRASSALSLLPKLIKAIYDLIGSGGKVWMYCCLQRFLHAKTGVYKARTAQH